VLNVNELGKTIRKRVIYSLPGVHRYVTRGVGSWNVLPLLCNSFWCSAKKFPIYDTIRQ